MISRRALLSKISGLTAIAAVPVIATRKALPALPPQHAMPVPPAEAMRRLWMDGEYECVMPAVKAERDPYSEFPGDYFYSLEEQSFIWDKEKREWKEI